MTTVDRRRINETWEFDNPSGDRFLFARIGSGKNSYIKTLAYIGFHTVKGIFVEVKTLEYLRLKKEGIV